MPLSHAGASATPADARPSNRTRLPQAVPLARLVSVMADAGCAVRLLPADADAERPIDRLATLEEADARSISFLTQARYAPQLAASAAGAVLIAPAEASRLEGHGAIGLVTAEPYLAFARLSQWWARQHQRATATGVHPSAIVSEGVQLHPSARIGAGAVVDEGARIGAHVQVGPHATVGAGACIGEGSRLAAGVTLAEGCVLGRRGLLHPGVVIGADGFGFATTGAGAGREHVKIEQLGAVVIGDDVEIGANSCIDRGALADTEIGNGVKIDNLNQIGHNCRIGEATIIAGCCGIAGSTRIGRRVMIGGAVGITGHLSIADDVVIGACSVVSRSLLQAGFYSGFFPIDDNASWERNAAALRQLDRLRRRVMALERGG